MARNPASARALTSRWDRPRTQPHRAWHDDRAADYTPGHTRRGCVDGPGKPAARDWRENPGLVRGGRSHAIAAGRSDRDGVYWGRGDPAPGRPGERSDHGGHVVVGDRPRVMLRRRPAWTWSGGASDWTCRPLGSKESGSRHSARTTGHTHLDH